MSTLFFTGDGAPVTFTCKTKREQPTIITRTAQLEQAAIEITEEQIGPFRLTITKVCSTGHADIFYSQDDDQPTAHFMLRGQQMTQQGNTSNRWDTSRAYFYQGNLQRCRLIIPFTKHWQMLQVQLPETFFAGMPRQKRNVVPTDAWQYIVTPIGLHLSPPIIRMLVEIVHCSFKNEKRRLFLNAKLPSLLTLAFEESNIANYNANASALCFQRAEKLFLAKQLLDQLDTQQFTPVESGRRAGISREYRASFIDFFGNDLTGYLQAKRMERAMQKIRNTEISLDAIATEAGFTLLRNFRKAFKEHYGLMTPSSFRRHLLANGSQ